MKITLIEIRGYDPVSATEKTLRFSDAGYATRPTDTPANEWYASRLQKPAFMQRSCFSQGTTSGKSSTGFGLVDLVNNDGGLDSVIDYGFDGRVIMQLTVEDGAAYSTAVVDITGTMEQPQYTTKLMSMKIRDRQAELDIKIQSTLYAGSNSLPAGLEGVSGDLKKKPKPITYGVVYNVSPPCVNTSRLIYQVNDGAISTVDAVYDKGAALSKGSDYTSQSDMETNSPGASNFRVWPGGGYFRLGTSPVGTVTADVTQGAAASNRTVAQICKSIAIDRGGIAPGDITTADITALDTADSSVVGIYIDSETNISNVLDTLCATCGAWWGFDKLGKFRIQRLEAPSGTPEAVYDDINIKKIEYTTDAPIPAWQVNLNYKKFYTVQSSDIAGSVTDARRAELALDFRSVSTEDTSVKTKHKLSKPLDFETLYTVEADASTEATRRLNLYKVRRDIVKITVEGSIKDLGAVVQVKINRFGYDAGKLFRIIGRADTGPDKADLTLWG